MSNLHRFHGFKAFLFVLGVAASSLASAAGWVSTGGPLGGLGYDVRIHPSNKSVMYVTDNYAGVSKSDNAGQTWSRTNSGITTKGGSSKDAVNIFSLTIDPNNSNTIWAGTFGEGQQFGVFKSTDAGATWTMKIKGISLGSGDLGLIFRGFTIQQGNSNVVYAQAEVRTSPNVNGWQFFRSKGRVYKTLDGGENWQMIWEGNALARYLIIDPGNSNVLYVSHGIFDIEPFDSDCKNGVYAGVGVLKSSDGGLTWSAINNGITDLTVGSLRMHPTNSQILFAATGNIACSGFGTANYFGGVFKTTNGGASWDKVITSHNGEPFTVVNFSPANPNTVYAGSPQAFYRSDDLGATWTAHQKEGSGAYGPPGIVAGIPIDVVIDPDNANTVYVNNYAGGIFRSLDGTATWETWSKGYTGNATRRLAISAGNPAALATIGRSGPYVSPNYGKDWVGIVNGEIASLGGNFNWHTVAVHPTNPAVILLADSFQGLVFRSTDNGNTSTKVFKDANAAPLGTIDPSKSQGFRGLAFAPSDPTIVYAGVSVDTHYYAPNPTGTVIYKSVDGGVTFNAMPSIIDGNNVNRLIVDPNDANKVYAATTNGVYKSTNGATSWTSSSALTGRKIEALALSSGTLIAGEVAGGIWTSADDGATWTGPHNTGFSSPNPTITALVFDTANANIVYAGDFISGVYKSSDKGLTWSPFPDSSMSGMDNRAINDLVLTNEVLYAATEGGGVFRYDFQPLTTAPTCTLSASPASISAGGTSTLAASCNLVPISYVWTGGTCAGTSGTSCTVTPSTTTSYTVAGINSAGTGAAASATVTVTVTSIAPSAPILTAATASYTSATLVFTAPTSTGGSPITGYTATCTAAGKTPGSGTGTSSPISVSGLVGETSYSCTLTATNSAGTGAASNALPLTTLAGTDPGSLCSSPLYCGPIIDNHAHPISAAQGNQNDYVDGLVTLMDQNGVTMTALHRNAYWATGPAEFGSAHDLWVTSASQRHPGRILTYLAGFDPSSPDALNYIQNQFQTSSQWKTIGELDLRNPGPKTQIPINSPNMMAVLKLAAQLHVPVSIHYEFDYGVDVATSKQELEEALSANPDTIVILAHTPVPDLMAKHPNLWAEFTPWAPQAEQILNAVMAQDPTLLDRVVLCATDLQGPDLMVGAGLATPITYGDAITSIRKLLGTLTPEQAEKIAYKNLVSLLNLTVPACTLTASPSTIAAGASATLTAMCTPAAISYAWTGGTCAGTSGASCTVTPSATTSYTVAGMNSAGDSPAVGATVTVSNGFPGNRSNYSITKTSTGFSIRDNVGAGGTVALTGATQIKFADMTVNLLIGDLSKTIPADSLKTLIELYLAFFNRIPGSDGLSYWINQFKAGSSINEIAESFYTAGIKYSSLTGFSSDMTPDAFINTVYRNVLGRPDGAAQAGMDYWKPKLLDGSATHGSLVTSILYSAHTYKGDPTWGWVADLLDNKYSVANYFCLQQGLNYNTPEIAIAEGMAIAKEVTATSTAAAIALIGVTDAGFDLTLP